MKRQYGVALISVLLIVALASILATKMTGKLIMQMQRTVNVTSNQQAYWYALGAEAFATSVLSKTFQNEPDVTHLGQFWAQGETSYPVEQGQITGQIFDLQACFNLNALRASDKNADGRLNINSSRENQGADNNPPSPSSDKDDNGKPIARQSFERLLRALNIEGVDEFIKSASKGAIETYNFYSMVQAPMTTCGARPVRAKFCASTPPPAATPACSS